MAEHEASLRVGPRRKPDQYGFGRVVGSGGQGAVHAGTIAVHGHDVDVAIKVISLPSDSAGQSATVAQVEEECELLRSIDPHPSIIGVREWFVGARPHYPGQAAKERWAVYLVMHWCSGKSLVSWVIDNPHRTFGDITSIVTGLCAGVAHLHAGAGTKQPVFHRDIKPANVLVGDDLGVKLVDFGIAAGQAIAPPPAGTLGYWAPELRRLADTRGLPTVASCESDLFSIAGVTYWLFTGTSPPEDLDRAVMRSALEASPVLAGQPKVVDQVLAGLSPHPSERSPWCPVTGWATGLLSNATSSTIPAGPPPPPYRGAAAAGAGVGAVPPTEPRRRGRKALPLVVAAVVLALLAALAATRLLDSGDGGDDVAAGADEDSTSTQSTEASTTTEATTTTAEETTTTEATTTTERPTTTAPRVQTVYLDELTAIGKTGPGFNFGGATSINGEPYPRSIWTDACLTATFDEEYPIGARFDTFEAVLGMNDDSSSDWMARISFLGDGSLIDEFDVAVGAPVNVSVPVTGVQRFEIIITHSGDTSCGGDGGPTLGDPKFTG